MCALFLGAAHMKKGPGPLPCRVGALHISSHVVCGFARGHYLFFMICEYRLATFGPGGAVVRVQYSNANAAV
jgi:hypothetical protein